ncbi:putative copper resistance protein D [Georgenia satyanarayanai]|uniref:Putative copper resistance protein D n=1 Tax=Georgenia satyanarayanai TaxID=860221 RepID=A0A2Y9AS25_9MICO|nr:bifunctional copper resistance protein CopD/cytochrome c oxidase assembly protein [Georgenia satyanarayanai]PYF96360.1 putative copper resistance protein D [Georgenia satyanarayanai]SSA46895.1 putative copper resistance protein D [Georgenia satyanarayanai]
MPILTTSGKPPHGDVSAGRGAPRAWPWAVAALPLVVVGLVAGLALSGAAAPRELIDPGPLVRWGLPLATSLARAAAAVTIGALMLCAVVLPRTTPAAPSQARAGEQAPRDDRDRRLPSSGEDPTWRRVANVAVVAAVVWALAQLAHLLLTHAAALGTVIGGPGYGAELLQFVTQIDMGRYLGVATLLAAIVAPVAAVIASHGSAAWAMLLAVAAFSPVSVTGHAAGAANHDFAVTSWWLHVTAVAVWVGGLAVLCVVASRLGAGLADVTERFSRIAVWAFAVATIAGAANAWIRFSTPLDLFVHPYGQLLLVKVVLTAALGLAGWFHRTMTIPAIRAETRPEGRAGWAFWRLAGVEVLIMGAVVGVAVALGSSAPPEALEPPADASPVYLLTGYPQPPAPTAWAYLSQWRPDPLTIFVAITALVVYLSWVWRLRRTGARWPAIRVASWVVGVLLFLWSTSGGPAVYGSVLVSAHLVHHMVLLVVVPILLVLGAPGALAMSVLPRREDGSRGPREWLEALHSSRFVAFVAHPVVATLTVAVSVVVFYYTPVFARAQDSPIWHAVSVVYFTAAGCNLVHALLAGPHRRPAPLPLRLGAAVAGMLFYGAWGMVLGSSTSLLAADHFGQLGLSWGVDARADQRAGGLVVWGIAEVGMLALALALILTWMRAPLTPARRSPAPPAPEA